MFLTIVNDKVMLEIGGRKNAIESVKQFKGLVANHGAENVMCSSSIDFPEDFTSNPATIKLAKALAKAEGRKEDQ
jgi:hypothetical protein